MLKEDLYLSPDLARMRTAASLSTDLDLERICQQYFLGEHGRNKVEEAPYVPKIIQGELLNPPTEPSVINERQKLVSALMSNAKYLTTLDKVTRAINWFSNPRNMSEHDLLHALGGLNLQAHRAVQYVPLLKTVEKIFARNTAFSTVNKHIKKVQEETNLYEEVRAWSEMRDSGLTIKADLDARTLNYELPTGEKCSIEEIKATGLVAAMDSPFRERLDPLLEVLDPFMVELYEVLSFYVTLAKYGVGLQESKISQTMPKIDDRVGYLDAKDFSNPLLGLENSIQIPKFSDDLDKHDYLESDNDIHIVMGRNKGSKSTWITGRGILQLQAQMGSSVPASYCRIGPIPTMGSVYIRQVDIGAGQSTFSRALNSFAAVLDTGEEKGLVILDDATEGTDPKNAQDYMNFILQKIHAHRMSAWIATQNKSLYGSDIVPASYYTTMPSSYDIRKLDGTQQPESVHWRDIAKKTDLASHLG